MEFPSCALSTQEIVFPLPEGAQDQADDQAFSLTDQRA